MKQLVLVGSWFVLLSASAVTLTVDKVAQRYPWNGIVDIEYTVTLADGETLGLDQEIEFLLTDKSTSRMTRIANFREAPIPKTAGRHHLTWEANGEGFTNALASVTVTARAVSYPAVFMVIDVSGGSTAETYPVDYETGVLPETFNTDEYKTGKIVLRRVHPGSFVQGSPSTEAGRIADTEKQFSVALTNAYYLGLFEVTQKQYENVMGSNPTTSKANYLGEMRPVVCISYNTLRGQANTTTHQYDWPWTNGVIVTSFMGKLRAKCRAKDANGGYTLPVEGFDLPTESEWEYACRAGKTTPYNDGTVPTANNEAAYKLILNELGRYSGNVSDGKGGYSAKTTNVGSYTPNSWGFYDMHGNVYEWCLDYYMENPTSQCLNPCGPKTGLNRSIRGGGCGTGYANSRSAHRYNYEPAKTFVNDTYPWGFRLACH